MVKILPSSGGEQEAEHSYHQTVQSPPRARTPNPTRPTPVRGTPTHPNHPLSGLVEKVVTTTTTQRMFFPLPHFLGRDPPLRDLDPNEYPLANKSPPPEIANAWFNDKGDQSELLFSRRGANLDPSLDTPSMDRTFHHSSPSPLPTDHQRPRQNQRPRSRGKYSSSAVSTEVRRRSNLNATTAAPRRSNTQESGTLSGGGSSHQSRRQARVDSGYLATPDTSESAGADFPHFDLAPRNLQLGIPRNSADQSVQRAEAPSHELDDSSDVYNHNVATPPVNDADMPPFAGTVQPLELHISGIAAQDASLPSPRLSPTLAAAHLQSTDHDQEVGHQLLASLPTTDNDPPAWVEEPLTAEESNMALVHAGRQQSPPCTLEHTGHGSMADPYSLLRTFDSMHPAMKTSMMFQFLRRCPRPTLRVVANVVNPELKCDFFSNLAIELSYHILSYLNHQDLCRAAQVSKHWRYIIDCNETGWKELFVRDGLRLPRGELEKAITQGWGWQDPVGSAGFERDFSMHNRLTLSIEELALVSGQSLPKTRTSKRKRTAFVASTPSASKRRASGQGVTPLRVDKKQTEVGQHPGQGPMSAASAAAVAVPDPKLGLPSLRQLHLFKSLYRRHHMIRQSWMNGKVKPSHVAFAAHPRHVITCLQFDEDKIITGSDDTFIHIYDTKTGKLRKKLAGHEGGVWALQYEGNILVSGSTDRSVRVWDIKEGICKQVFYGHTSTVRCLQILMPSRSRDASGKVKMQPENPLIITGSRDSQLRVWRLPEEKSKPYKQLGVPSNEAECPYFIRALTGHNHSVRAISAHGDTLVSGSYDSHVRVWRISTGECLHKLTGHTQKVYSVVLDHERNRCISGSMDSLVKIWDLDTGACLYTLEGHSLLVGLLDLRDERLVSAAADSTLRIWDPETGRCKNTLMAHTGAITCFQHDSQKVISGSEKTIKLWDVKTGECMQDLLTDLSGVWQVKFDGRRCVAAVQRDGYTFVEVSYHSRSNSMAMQET